MKVKATVRNLNDLGYTLNKDIQIAICDTIFDAIDCAKPDIGIGFAWNVCVEPEATAIMRGDSATVLCGVGAIIGAVERSIYPFDKFNGKLGINITVTKEES